MKSKIFKSIRVEIITYVILSIVLSLITTFVLVAGLFMAKSALTNNTTEHNTAVNMEGITTSSAGEGRITAQNESILYRYGNEARIKFIENRRFTGFMIIFATVSFVLFFAVYFLFFTRKITDYFDEIARGLEEISEGNFDIRFEVRNEDELSRIAGTLNRTTGEIKRILAKERDEEKSRKEFITSIAHDLRTPLTSVIGYMQLVMSKMEESRNSTEAFDKNEEYLHIAYDKAIRLQGLIEDLFSFTKTDSPELRLHLDEIDMVKLMEQLIDECYPSLSEAGLTLEFRRTADVMKIEADGELMARAVANLLTNAIKYGKDGKQLIVELRQDGRDADFTIRVINYGKLIPAKDIDHIFDRFYRVEDSRSVETGGTGLGLAITQNIVGLHGGRISVRSDERGTVFEIKLPAVEQRG